MAEQTPESPLADLRLRDFAPRTCIRTPVTEVHRPAHEVIDAHNHLGRWLSPDWMVPDVGALIETMDAARVSAVVNLDGRWGDELEANLDRYDRAHPGRFFTFCQADWSLLRDGDASRLLEEQLRRSVAAGARGLKVWKDLGLEVRDGRGDLVMPDDARLRPLFAAAGDLGVPVLIHTADPIAFFTPLDRHNERLDELGAFPEWWFGGPGLPSFDDLIDSLERLVASCPQTTFVAAHVGCAAEDLARVDAMLTAHPNYFIDLSARMAELGRQPRAARRLIERHPSRVLFGTDVFPVSLGDYLGWYRFLETDDECFDYEPSDEIPPQGRWQVSALDLPADLLADVYAANARRVLGITP
jgi:predicted TIM-barrel fold metal-dependent hydrolase